MEKIDVYEACYIYSLLYHTGQWSRAYRLGCIVRRKGYHPGLGAEHGETESLEAQQLIDKLIARNY